MRNTLKYGTEYVDAGQAYFEEWNISMIGQHETITIEKVGISSEPLCIKVGRGVFNFDSLLDYLSYPPDSISDEITIDLSRVGWISQFDWCAFMCILHGQIGNNPDIKIRLDFVGGGAKDLIPYKDCANYLAGRMTSPRFSDDEYNDSYAVHRVLNFVKSLEGLSGFENVARGQIILARLKLADAGKPGWYRKDSDVEKSIILPRTNIETTEMCLKFASKSQIELWREAMAINRIPNAAVFQSSEFWRVLCHELARNVVEHAKGPGFISGRVILPKASKWPLWCYDVYEKSALDKLDFAKENGFVELCVSDAGVGIPSTIELSYRNRYRERHREDLQLVTINPEDLLKFAFDELGTSKDADRSWITDRHALGHILFIIEKYGGILSVRSKGAALTYYTGTDKFKRCTSQLGFEPQHSYKVRPAIPGTHLQLLIPLTPQKSSNTSRMTASFLPNPPSYHIDHRHPVGPLVPVRDKLGTLSMGIEGDDTFKFKEAIRIFACELLQGGHPRNQMLVFDFSEVDWIPEQFETFLYLMQNVFLNRLFLFTNVSHDLAELVNSKEDENLPTYLPDSMREDIQKRALEWEFTDGRFLETYSSLGELVLALGPDRGEYIFGVRNKGLRTALLGLINGERQTIQSLCKTHKIDPHVLSAVLHHASQLFRTDDLQRWGSVLVRGEANRDDLEVQRLRTITSHFDIVAKQCYAWRGRRTYAADGAVERFYLPSEDAIYTEFFETSRILSRERYVLEVAERLLYRLCRGLVSIPIQGLTLNDIDILACSSTPTVMLAEAIRRAWPVERDGKRPVVIDYGPSLFSGADPAHILDASKGNLRGIVVHDLFDGGTLSRKVVNLADKQGINILFVLSFIRFLDPSECIGDKAQPFPPESSWGDVHTTVGKPVHAMIGLRRPAKTSWNVQDWGVGDCNRDYVVDPRSLRPVLLSSLRLESGYSEERSLTKRDSLLNELDIDGGVCKLAAGHFVYGHRHFAVVIDVRGVLTGAIGYKIISWLADLCCDYRERNVQWEEKRQEPFHGEVTAILLPLHSQIHYILPGLQMELAQRGRRVPHFFLDATSFGGGLETYDVPYQLQDQITNAAKAIKALIDGQDSEEEKQPRVKAKQLRLLIIDDAIFSGRAMHTILDSLSNHVLRTSERIYGKEAKYQRPIDWIRAFTVFNELPAARSALWHQLNTCSASNHFRFDEYAPFTGVATFSAADCPTCRKREQLEHLSHRVKDVGPTYAAEWIRERKETLTTLTTEAPSFNKIPSPNLPEPIDVLVLPSGGAQDRYKPIHVDSAIWRFYELIYLSYPIRDVLMCLQPTRKAGQAYPNIRDEYARFRLAVYDWCIHNWHQVHLYHAEEQVLSELKAEVEANESIFVEIIYLLHSIIQYELVLEFVRWAIGSLAESDADRRCDPTETTLNLDTALTLFFLALSKEDLDQTGLLKYLDEKQALMPRKSSFLAFLYLRLTRPRVAKPDWALNTIAETCFRGRLGDNAEERRTIDHELLGRLANETARNSTNVGLRRRLESSLDAFIAAVNNLQPYYDDDLLSSVVAAANNVRDWLQKPLEQALDNTTPLKDLINSIFDKAPWEKFAELCHMPASKLKSQLEARLQELREDCTYAKENNSEDGVETDQHRSMSYGLIELNVDVNPEVLEWCLMTHIPRLVACLSNIALEPAKRISPFAPSQIIIKPCVPNQPQLLTIEVLTHFGSATEALKSVKKSVKIGRSFDDLRLFGTIVEEPELVPDSSENCLRFTLVVPVGYQ